MRTLALLLSLLLLALHAQAQPLGEEDDQVPAQDQPGADVQGMTISFEGDERSTRDASGSKATLVCHCSRTFCQNSYQELGTCTGIPSGTLYRLCCRRG
ncbi:Paneth cell-specific alpha-defensin 11 precursor [Equus caballus]|uniref:Paneth cell-specific alpha-defensin 11 n=1 Tax=Equus caballus TaxID=9796 RepID=C8BNG4_HORSE|nr:Paneth cell-specific alpha-defensin 11 precursor [Equus caballus]ACV49737.1 Paneth cell-specific alpha-defensin 11 [Equus caballus]